MLEFFSKSTSGDRVCLSFIFLQASCDTVFAVGLWKSLSYFSNAGEGALLGPETASLCTMLEMEVSEGKIPHGAYYKVCVGVIQGSWVGYSQSNFSCIRGRKTRQSKGHIFRGLTNANFWQERENTIDSVEQDDNVQTLLCPAAGCGLPTYRGKKKPPHILPWEGIL